MTKLVTHVDAQTVLWNTPAFEQITRQFFELEIFDNTKQYNTSTIFLLDSAANINWAIPYLNQGCKAVIVNGECAVINQIADLITQFGDRILILTSGVNHSNHKNLIEIPNWFWYSYVFTTSQIERDYSSEHSYKFLMLMGRKDPWRDLIWHSLKNQINQSLCSYTGRGIILPNTTSTDSTGQHNNWEVNPDWYNTTGYSMVVESLPEVGVLHTYTGTARIGHIHSLARIHLTEKTFKPLAHGHPFLVVGCPGILSYLKSQGFETYENLFDESYDSDPDGYFRLLNVVEQANSVIIGKYDNLTLEKMRYNANKVYDKEYCKQQIIKEILEPILKFIEK